MSGETKTPVLRFPDALPWEEKQLDKVVSFKKGKGYSKADLTESGTPVFLYGRMYTDYRFSVDGVDTFADLRSDSVLSTGAEVVVPASGETAEDIARATAIKASGIILGGDLNVLTPLVPEKTDTSVLALALSNGTPSFEIATRAQGGTISHVHKDDLEDVLVSLPSSPTEQQSIGGFFRELDALIAEREKALGKLESLKKAMLEKMFPQGDAKVPEVRFKGFEGEWEEHDFENVFQHIPSKHYQIPTEEYLSIGQFPVVDQGKIPIVGFTNNTEKVCRAKDNPVIVFGDHTREIKYVDFDFVVGADGTQLLRSSKHDLRFLYSLLAGMSLPNMGYSRHFKFLQEAVYVLPLNPSEQQAIGSFFRSLDALLAARREEAEKLKQLKKAFLERMFA